mmetsp:Transcript_17483/g.24114  ORF Transcript_17483/g.24114 Transcript_17483/m.24114 type:complete len:192 (-) Transcript_17483:612-1187(-)|eukprot:CAMPEP_0185739796 /NCGR_PEP_ID=MMETSP1171-20130828/36270_1 /TAXON_ID=374046 /ORGANISM="Helicotheca tamensis, Strain CCMP826" /LENGTH=191 /DNA_ID=CAMNT_0028411451 /DNA_START=156 /DNA_END=731 /DNA_ORIENTATION=+
MVDNSPNEKTLLIEPSYSSDTGIISLDGETTSTMDGSSGSSPPLLVWIGPALVCAFAYALYNIFVKKSSDSIHPILGGVVLQFVAALFGSLLLLVIVVKEGMDDVHYDRSGILWSVLAGLAVGAAEMLSFLVMGMGAQAMQVIPVVIGGSVMFGTILGWCWLHEVLSMQGWIGVLGITVGIGLVASDPGST